RAAEDAVVMLRPEHVRRARALHDAVRILGVGLPGELRRHVLGAHALRLTGPALAVVFTDPHAAAGHAHDDVIGIARIDLHRVDARPVGPTPEPHLALLVIPEGAIQLPALASIVGAEESAGDGAAPQGARTTRGARGEGPDLLDG